MAQRIRLSAEEASDAAQVTLEEARAAIAELRALVQDLRANGVVVEAVKALPPTFRVRVGEPKAVEPDANPANEAS